MIQIDVLQRILAIALVVGAASSAGAAEGGTWSVGKSSGEVWITTTDAQPASLKQEEKLKPGDTIRTGRNGRVLLLRGEETILISPNSVVGVPAETKEGLSTTIAQQAGSILLEVEKRNVKHFEVETPYLAALVKGTQFSVTVNAESTSVAVRRGQVEVLDFKSGQIAQVMPGQAATAFAHGKGGLSLSGSGTFEPIEHGKPRASSIERVPVPKTGLAAPRQAANGSFIHALGHVDAVKMEAATTRPQKMSGDAPLKPKGARISAALGEVRVNFQRVTHGLAHATVAPGSPKSKDTVWNDTKAAGANGQSQGNSGASGNGNTAGGSAAASSSGVSTVAVVAGSGNSSENGNGNGANGNGKGNSGNGNGGVGNGNGKGNAKH